MNAFTVARRSAAACVLGLFLTAGCSGEQPVAMAAPAAQQAAEGVSVYFAPETDLGALVIQKIGAATRSVHVLAYSLSSAPIADALIAAHKRGVEVRVVIDAERAGEKESESKRLANAGVATFADSKESKAHSKIMLIDGETIVTGSFNFAETDEKTTSDNLVLIQGKGKVIDAYEANFMLHLEHSKRVKPR